MFLLRNQKCSGSLKIFPQSALVYSTCPVNVQKESVSPPVPTKLKKRLVDTPEEYKNARPFSEIPGPSVFNLVANMVLPTGKYYKLGMKELHTKVFQEYGNVFRFPGMFGRDPVVIVYNADLVEKMFRNEGQWPDRKGFEFFQDFREKVRPDIYQGMAGLLQGQGQDWQETRTKVNPVMIQPKTVRRYIEPVQTIADDFVTRVRSLRDERDEVPADFGNEMNKWALESVCYVALDQRLGLFKDTDPNSDDQRLIKHVHEFFTLSFEMEVKPSLWKYFKTAQYNRMMNCLSTMTDIIISYIDKSIAEMDKKPNQSEDSSVLESLLKIDKRVAVIMALDMIMAGVDTTSNAVLILLYLLAKNPEKQELLRKELREKLPEKDSPFTAESMKNLPYLRACMKEAQRLEPIIIGTVRRAMNDMVLEGYQIPKGIYIAGSQYIMSKNEKNFKRPNEFIPERFLKSGSCPELQSNQPFAFLPFGFGPRMCIGKRIAELEIEIVVAKLIRNFSVEWHHPEMKYVSTFINAPTGDLKYRFVELKD